MKLIVRHSLRVVCDLLSTTSILLAILIVLGTIKDTGADTLLAIACFCFGLICSGICTHLK